MNHSYHNNRGFSTLMVLGTIGILLILVVGLASTYIREMKLSRTSYDEVLAYANAEGMFEYAMLKVRNHREWFQDTVTNSDTDGKILIPTTLRSRGMGSSYTIEASSLDTEFMLESNNHLILPLFSSPGIALSGLSRNPTTDTTTLKSENLTVDLGNLSWTIVAMSGSESVGLTGSGDITTSNNGIIRHKNTQCYNGNTWDEISCSLFDASRWDEELQYFYDNSISVGNFIRDNSDPYLMVFNNALTSQNIRVRATTPFSLPTLSIRSEAQKNNSVQVFEFTEDKSRYYDALKYGVYNTD